MTYTFTVVVEQTDTGYSAYSPDLPGCAAAGGSRDEVESAMRDALKFHLDGMRADGQSIPPAHSYATTVVVAA